MNEGLLAILAVGALTAAILVLVYREPERNAMDEVVVADKNNSAMLVSYLSTYGASYGQNSGQKGARMNIFQKAQQGLNLTPGQRAFLKLVDGLVIAAILAAIPIVGSAVSTRLREGNIDWTAIALFALGTFGSAFAAAVVKYCKAHMDNPLAVVVGQAAQSVEDRLTAQFGLNEPVIEASVDEPPPPDDGAPAAAAQAA